MADHPVHLRLVDDEGSRTVSLMPSAEYMRRYRQTLEGQAALLAQKRRDQARRRAIARLISRHKLDFDLMFREELEKVIAQDRVDT